MPTWTPSDAEMRAWRRQGWETEREAARKRMEFAREMLDAMMGREPRKEQP